MRMSVVLAGVAATVGALVLAWTEEQAFSDAQRAFLLTVGNLFAAAAERVTVVERSEMLRFVGASDALLGMTVELSVMP